MTKRKIQFPPETGLKMKILLPFLLLLSITTSMSAQDYSVVVSKQTLADPQWKQVVDALVQKHQARVVTYTGSVEQARADLARTFPRYACFVATPEEAGRMFVVTVHRMTRTLDDDPYTDVIWGILTGYDAADALRIAKNKEPLLIKRGAGGTGIDMDAFEQSIWFSEGEKGAKFVKLPDAQGKQQCPDDSTESIVEMLNTFKPEIFITSGHATFRDWQIGYSYRNGQLRCRDGQLFGVNLKGQKFPINSPEPKVYLPCGNCLIGLIPDRQCMALAWMHSGGAYQMAAYTVSTFFGYGGWGIRDYFIGQAGRFSFAESFIANNLALVHQLQTRFPRNAAVNLEKFDIESDPSLPNRMAQQFHIRERDELGLLWDRDTVAFYGDPAWNARLSQARALAWTQKLTENDGTYTFEISANTNGNWGGRPVIEFLPRRLEKISITGDAGMKPVITDNFILLPLNGDFEKGKQIKITFTAQRIR